MTELINIICRNYADIDENGAKILLDLCKDKIIKVYDKELLTTIGIYFKLEDETLKDIESKKIDLKNSQDVMKVYDQNGNNIHFYLCISNKATAILKGIKKVIKKENPKTISWFSPDMKQFFIRRTLCHQ